MAKMHAADQRTIDVEHGSADAVSVVVGLSAAFRRQEMQHMIAEMMQMALGALRG